MWAGMSGRARARLQLFPLRETGRRSRQEWLESPPSCDYLVYFGDFVEVDGGRQ